jgi:hypothetical protein
MVNIQDTHIGATPLAALLHDSGSGIKDFHEGYRPRCHPLCGTHYVPLWSEVAKGKTGASSGLMNQGHAFETIKDANY